MSVSTFDIQFILPSRARILANPPVYDAIEQEDTSSIVPSSEPSANRAKYQKNNFSQVDLTLLPADVTFPPFPNERGYEFAAKFVNFVSARVFLGLHDNGVVPLFNRLDEFTPTAGMEGRFTLKQTGTTYYGDTDTKITNVRLECQMASPLGKCLHLPRLAASRSLHAHLGFTYYLQKIFV
jgi:hypothetical protein